MKLLDMVRKIIFLHLLVSIVIGANAQENAGVKRNLTLKYSLSSLIGDMYAKSMGIGLGIEKNIKESLSFSQEVSYLFHVEDNVIFRENLERFNGIKLTTEVRKYLKKNEIPESGLFTSAELKNILTQSTEDVYINGPQKNDITRYRGVLTANLGYLVYWDKHKKSRITLELLLGGGLGYVHADSSVDTDLHEVNTDYNSKKGFYPCLNFDIKIGFVKKLNSLKLSLCQIN